jgi:hypothetical protein
MVRPLRDEGYPLQAEMRTDGIEVGDLAFHRETRRVRRELGSAGAALVVEDDGVVLRQRCEIAGNALEIDAGAAVNRDDRVTAATDHAIEETGRIGCRDVAFVHPCLLLSQGWRRQEHADGHTQHPCVSGNRLQDQ